MKHALESDPEWLKDAFSYEGMKEIRGSKDNPTIVKFFKDVGHGWVKDDETAWCAAFVGAVLAASGLPHTNSLAARSYLQWGKRTTKPKRGDVVVFKRGNSSWQGHVAFYLGQSGGRVYVLGGNQSNAVNVKGYTKKSLLGYRTPVDLRPVRGNSRTMKATLVGGGTVAAGAGMELYEVLRGAGTEFTGLGYEWLTYAGSALVLLSLGVIAYARYTDWQRKAR